MLDIRYLHVDIVDSHLVIKLDEAVDGSTGREKRLVVS